MDLDERFVQSVNQSTSQHQLLTPHAGPEDPKLLLASGPLLLSPLRGVVTTTQMLALRTLVLMIQTIDFPGPSLLLSLRVTAPF